MSVYNKISCTAESLKAFDDDKPTVTVESDKKITVDGYSSIRLFTDTQIEVVFGEYDLGISGGGLVIKKLTPYSMEISGRISSVVYTPHAAREENDN